MVWCSELGAWSLELGAWSLELGAWKYRTKSFLTLWGRCPKDRGGIPLGEMSEGQRGNPFGGDVRRTEGDFRFRLTLPTVTFQNTPPPP